jgi:hypothetical protein
MAEPSQPILIADSGCYPMLLSSIWRVLKWTGCHILMTGAFAGRNVGEKLPIISDADKLIDENGNAFVAIAHEALYDSNTAQVESLLSIHQSLANPKN